jgi:AbrB family looped-hinge helix DNA binding protein
LSDNQGPTSRIEALVKAIVAERGHVTIPKPLRDNLDIRPGTALEFIAKDGALVARKAETDRDFAQAAGLTRRPKAFRTEARRRLQ